KNARELIVREYEDTEAVRLPDERYQIRLKYFDFEQLVKERNAYDKQMEAFKNEIFHLRDVVEAIYQGRKSMFKVTDFEDLARKVSGRIRKVKKDTDPLYEEIEQVWNKITSIKAEMTELEKLNQTYLYEKTLYKKLLANLRSKIQRVYGHQNPGPRVILDGQLDFLYAEFDSFEYLINPYHILPGLLLDVDITSIKRKRYTLATMGNVLNEFLSGVSRGFQDAAFAAFKHRRALREERPPVREPVFPVESAAPSVQAEANAREDELKVKANVTPSPQRRRQGPSGNFAEL
ncbi:MAG: cytochrome C oxidase subunit II, partial [Spirochaetales bacterium]|nr:cytochrome C oxidase subunit II [Spirochaetales bacterium]